MKWQNKIKELLNVLCSHIDLLIYKLYNFYQLAFSQMEELMRQMRNPAHTLGGSVGTIPKTLMALAHSGSGQMSASTKPNISQASVNGHRAAHPKMKGSKSYTHGLSGSIGMVRFKNNVTKNPFSCYVSILLSTRIILSQMYK